jgi:thioredoxin
MTPFDIPPPDPTIVEVVMPKCPTCAAMERDIGGAAARHRSDVRFVRIDASSDRATAEILGVRATPTIVAFRGGGEVFRSVGRLTPRELDAVFEAVSARGEFPRLGARDAVIRVGAGVVVSAIGLASGPVWPLVGIGVVITAFGIGTWLRR